MNSNPHQQHIHVHTIGTCSSITKSYTLSFKLPCIDKPSKLDGASLSIPIITWNVENLKRNFFILSSLATDYSVKLIFLSESQVYQCDVEQVVDQLRLKYDYFLNSEDLFDSSLPLCYPRAKGGTMVLWDRSLSPYVRILEAKSSHFVSLLLTIPGVLPTVHTAVYLPTAGRIGEWTCALSDLETHLNEIQESLNYPILCL